MSLLADVVSTVVGNFFACDKGLLDDKLKMNFIKTFDTRIKGIHNVFCLKGLQYEDLSENNCHAEEPERCLYSFFPENSPLNWKGSIHAF